MAEEYDVQVTVSDLKAKQNQDSLRSVHEYGKFDSWEIIDEDTARKTCDKSFFQHHGSSVAQAIRWFFGAEDSDVGETIDLTLVYHNKPYAGRIEKSESGIVRTRIFWRENLAKEFKPYADDGKQHVLEFHRIGKNKYEDSIF